MSTDKLLSIIIPSYNMENYLGKCIDSLIIANFDKIEVLVVNDGSQDSTLKIACDYELRYPKSIRVIDKKNGNYGSCINAALEVASGKYVRILDADDRYITNNLEKFIAGLSEINDDCVITDYQIVDQYGSVKSTICFNELRTDTSMSLPSIENILLKKIAMHSVTFRRTIFDNLNYKQTEGISYTDVEWIYTPIAVSRTFRYFPLVIYSYLLGREGQTVDPKVVYKHFSDTLIGIEKQTNILMSWDTGDKNQISYLTKKLAKRILRNYKTLLSNKEETEELLKKIDLKYKNIWEKYGIDLEYMTAIPFIHKSFVKEWRKYNYYKSYKFPNIYHIYNHFNSTLSWRLSKIVKPDYMKIR